MDRFLNIFQETQPEKIIDETKLRHIASQISKWEFFGIHQADYLAFSKDKKIKNVQQILKEISFKIFWW